MILVDSSVWTDHFRHRSDGLVTLLDACGVLVHPFIIGELACGNLKNRANVLHYLSALPAVTVASEAEVLAFIESRELMGRGLGYIAIHLLAATALTPGASLWTFDRALAKIAAKMAISATT